MSALRSSRCCICHSEATNNHHEPPKGQVGDHDDTITLCGNGNADGCHGLAHGTGGVLSLHKPTGEGIWHFCAEDKRAASAISRRAKRHGLPTVKPGLRYAVIPIEECSGLDEFPTHRFSPDAASEVEGCNREAQVEGSMEHALEVAYREVSAADYAVFRCRSERFAEARDFFRDTYGDGWEPRFIAWRRELVDEGGNPIPVTDVQAHRMLTVADHLPQDCARHLPVTRQILLATAVRDGRGSAEALLPKAESLTAKQFEIEVLGAEEPEPKQGVCPDCGVTHLLTEFTRKETT